MLTIWSTCFYTISDSSVYVCIYNKVSEIPEVVNGLSHSYMCCNESLPQFRDSEIF